MKIIIAGSEGLLGQVVSAHLEKDYDVARLDKKLGHDLTNPFEIEELLQSHSDAIGLVNLFALNPQPGEDHNTLYDLPLNSVWKYLEVNSYALFAVCREFAKTCKRGSIINFASTYGIVAPRPDIYPKGTIKHPAYTITKASVIGLTKWLAVHLAPSIRVNAIAPGGVENGQDSEFIAKYSNHTPMGRMMRKEEIIGPVKFLLSDDSSYVTGHVLVVDGGWTSW